MKRTRCPRLAGGQFQTTALHQRLHTRETGAYDARIQFYQTFRDLLLDQPAYPWRLNTRGRRGDSSPQDQVYRPAPGDIRIVKTTWDPRGPEDANDAHTIA